MIRWAGLAALALGLVSLLGFAPGCATSRPSGDSTDAAYQRALSVLAGDRVAGEAALDAFVAASPRSPHADEAGVRLAQLALERDQPALAEQRLRQVLDTHPIGDQSDRARLLLMQLLADQGRTDEAYSVGSRTRMSLLTPGDRREAHRLLADLAGARGEVAARLRWLGRVRADQPHAAGAAAVDAEIDAMLEPLTDEDLSRLRAALGNRPPAARLLLLRAERALRAGDLERAARALDEAAQLPLSASDAERHVALTHWLESNDSAGAPIAGLPPLDDEGLTALPAGLEGTIGAVLPLSGAYAGFGEETLQGLLLSFGLLDATAAVPSRLQVLVRDSAGDPARAASAVSDLAANPDVIAIVGPLLPEASEAAAVAAEAAQVPLLSLTRRDTVADLGAYVLQLGMSPIVEAEWVADYAIAELGLRRFALLYPDDEFGRTLRGVFWDAVEARGAEMVGVARYEVDATDFADPIERLIGFDLIGRAERAAIAKRSQLRKRARRLPPEQALELRREAHELTGPHGAPLPPFVDFDALFIPDSHESVALIAPHLAFHDVRGVRLLGISAWNDPALLSIGGRHLNGAVFAARFFAASDRPRVRNFTARFAESFGSTPGFLAGQAYDAGGLLLLQLAAGRGERDALLAGLLATRAYPGVGGALAIDATGRARRRPLLLGVENGEFMSVDERGVAPEVPPAPVHPWEIDEQLAPAEATLH